MSTLKLYSHQGQDRWVTERVFPGKRNGWFIDAGAGPDGIQGSNSYALESQLGWTGLLAEPHPSNYLRVKANRSAIVEQICLTDVEAEIEFLLHEFPELSTANQDLSEPNFVAAKYDREEFQKVRVKGVPLAQVLRRHHAPSVIEFLSLDIEGNEWVALKDFPFSEFRILAMTIERGAKSYNLLKAKLIREGYRLVHVAGPDDFYVHSSVPYSMTFKEALDTRLRSTWNTLYFQEPMLTVRRIARQVRALVRKDYDATDQYRK